VSFSLHHICIFALLIKPGQRDIHNCTFNTDLLKGCILWTTAGSLAGERFDLIVSNPPYIAAADPHLVAGDVRFEPSSALVAGADGLDDLRVIAAQAPAHLLPGGWLLLEHGYDQSASVRALLAEQGFIEVASRTDLGGHERITLGRLPC